MASTDASPLGAVERLEAPGDRELAALQQLVVDSRWNQVPLDWRLFLDAGTVYGVRGADGGLVASGAVLPMGAPLQAGATGVSWISMILVTPARRGHGLGRAVFDRCLRHVQAQGRIPMLDATPAGEALYAKFGFLPLWRLARWRREAGEGELGFAFGSPPAYESRQRVGDGDRLVADARSAADARPVIDAGTVADGRTTADARPVADGRIVADGRPAGDDRPVGWGEPAGEPQQRDALAHLASMDAHALGFDRRHVLKGLAARSDSACIASADAAALVRAGRTAHHIGPLLATREEAAAGLLADIAGAARSALLADVPDDRPFMRAALEAAGFRQERTFARMALVATGQSLPAGDTAFIHAIAGPEFA